MPWWTSFWGLPVRALFRRLAAASRETRRLLLCHNLEDHEAGALKNFLTLGAFSAAEAFVVHSEEDRARLLRRFPGRPVAAIPLPALDLRADRELARRSLRTKGGQSSGCRRRRDRDRQCR